MAGGFAKLSSSLVLSTVWREPHHVRIVWITMLALADATGHVGASVPGLADAARVTLEECEQALAAFMQPDTYSRTKTHDGRRIEADEGGWRLLNYALYRAGRDPEERRRQTREATARWRARRTTAGEPVSRGEPTVSHGEPSRAHAEAEAEAEGSTPNGVDGARVARSRTKPRPKPWRRLPADFEPTAEHRALAADLGVNIEGELAKCRDHEFKRGRTDAGATFRTWLRQAAEFSGGGGRNGAPVQRGGLDLERMKKTPTWLEPGVPS
jgi:hypothetical protein